MPSYREEHDAELAHDQVESAGGKWQLQRIGLLPIHSLHSRSELAAFDHWLVEVRGRDRHVGRKYACEGFGNHSGTSRRFQNAARKQRLRTIRHDLCIWGKVQRYEIAVIEFCQCPGERGSLVAGHGCLPSLLVDQCLRNAASRRARATSWERAGNGTEVTPTSAMNFRRFIRSPHQRGQSLRAAQ